MYKYMLKRKQQGASSIVHVLKWVNFANRVMICIVCGTYRHKDSPNIYLAVILHCVVHYLI